MCHVAVSHWCRTPCGGAGGTAQWAQPMGAGTGSARAGQSCGQPRRVGGWCATWRIPVGSYWTGGSSRLVGVTGAVHGASEVAPLAACTLGGHAAGAGVCGRGDRVVDSRVPARVGAPRVGAWLAGANHLRGRCVPPGPARMGRSRCTLFGAMWRDRTVSGVGGIGGFCGTVGARMFRAPGNSTQKSVFLLWFQPINRQWGA